VPLDDRIIRDTFALAHNFNSKESPPSDWLALAFSNWIATGGRASDSAVFIIPDKWREVIQGTGMGNSAGRKVKKQR
jgi:uncharacterized membrane protein